MFKWLFPVVALAASAAWAMAAEKVDSAQSVPTSIPAWLQQKIDRNTYVNGLIIQQVYAVRDMDGRLVYNIPGLGDDTIGSWHDAEGKVLCTEGGIMGKVKGTCPRVVDTRVLIYDKNRS